MINNYAIIESCGRQFWVEPSKFYDFSGFGSTKNFKKEETNSLLVTRRNDIEPSSIVIFNRVLMVSNDKGIHLGKPFLNNFVLQGNLLPGARKKSKIKVFKMRSKKGYRRTIGSKVLVNRVKLDSILKIHSSNSNKKLEFLIK